MNTWQALLRIQSLLRARLWRGFVGDAGVGSKVWADESVRATMNPLEQSLVTMRPPAILIQPQGHTADEEEPGLLQQEITIVLMAAAHGDQIGEHALMGANRSSKNSSDGRGSMEFEPELFGTIKLLTAGDELSIIHKSASANVPAIVARVGYLVMRAYTFIAVVSDELEHQHARTFAGSETGGTVTLTWTAPDDTAGLVEYIVRRVAGFVPTPNPDGGTSVALGSPLDLTVADAPAANTYTYSLFAGYDSEGGASGHNFSNYEAVTVVVP